MSYILNALKQSESQRNRGEIPHIDSQPEFVTATPSQWSEPFWKWLALAAALILLLGLAWFRFGEPLSNEQARRGAESVRPAAPVPPPAPPAQAAEQGPGLPALAEMAGVRVSLGEGEALGVTAPSAAAPSKPESPRVVLELPVSRGVIPSPAPSAAQTAPASAPVAAPVVGETREAEVLSGVSHWKTLPAEVQKQLREMAFTAHIYSSKPEARFIRVSGRTLREGDPLAAGLRLQQITRDGIVFAHDGEEFWFGFN